MRAVKWSRAVHHVEELARRCDTPSPVPMLAVTGLWVFGDLLGEPRDLDWCTSPSSSTALDDVPWLDVPRGGQHWPRPCAYVNP